MCGKQDTKNEKKFRDIMTHVSEKRADRYNTLWADPTANPQVIAPSRVTTLLEKSAMQDSRAAQEGSITGHWIG